MSGTGRKEWRELPANTDRCVRSRYDYARISRLKIRNDVSAHALRTVNPKSATHSAPVVDRLAKSSSSSALTILAPKNCDTGVQESVEYERSMPGRGIGFSNDSSWSCG